MGEGVEVMRTAGREQVEFVRDRVVQAIFCSNKGKGREGMEIGS